MYGVVWYGMVWYGMVWYAIVWYDMVWFGKVIKKLNNITQLRYVESCYINKRTLDKGNTGIHMAGINSKHKNFNGIFQQTIKKQIIGKSMNSMVTSHYLTSL